MADIDFDDFDDFAGPGAGAAGRFAPLGAGRPMRTASRSADPGAPHPHPLPARLQRLVNGAGALTSVALILGLGVWGYQLAVRDVTGIPVIRALAGPARVAPDEPGGELALHQGMAVNSVSAEGIAAAPEDSMTLAPPATGLAEEDQPMTAGVAAGAGSVGRPGLASAAAAAPTAPQASLPSAFQPAGRPARIGEPLPDGPVEAAIEPVLSGAGADVAAGAGVDAGAEVAAPVAVIAADVPGLARSPRPVARPAARSAAGPLRLASVSAAEAPDAMATDAMAEAAAAAVAAAFAPAPALDVAPEDLAPGTRLVQIGTFADAGSARAEWDRAAERFGALLDDKRRVIEPAVREGQTFYRLRVAGFDDIAEARRFCDALMADGAECVPAQAR